MFGNWLKWKSLGSWWQYRGPVTRTDIDKARQTVDTICRLKALVESLRSENAVLRAKVNELEQTR